MTKPPMRVLSDQAAENLVRAIFEGKESPTTAVSGCIPPARKLYRVFADMGDLISPFIDKLAAAEVKHDQLVERLVMLAEIRDALESVELPDSPIRYSGTITRLEMAEGLLFEQVQQAETAYYDALTNLMDEISAILFETTTDEKGGD